MSSSQFSTPFSSLMRRSTGLWLVGLIVIATVILRWMPEIDLEISRIFGTADGFPLVFDPFWRAVRRVSITLTKILVPLLLLLWLFRLLRPKRHERFSFAKLGFATLSLILGPALVTNLLLKENWGRPRPREIEEFGGDDRFVLPWSMSDQCLGNCSFVSGETSAAIWLLALIPLLPLALHGWALFGIAAYTLLISALRIAFGAHFFSDVVFSVLLNGLVIWCVWGLFFKRDEGFATRSWATETRASGPLQRLGRPIRVLENLLLPPIKLVYSSLMNKVRSKF